MAIVILCTWFSWGACQGPGPDAAVPVGYQSRHRSPLVDLKPPVPLGGLKAIQNNITYPDTSNAGLIRGTVTIECIINIDGQAEEIQPILGPEALFDAAILAVELSQWFPGRVDGFPVATPVRFELDFGLPSAQQDKVLPTEGQAGDSLAEVLISMALFSGVFLLLRVI